MADKIARVYTPTEAILQWWRKKIENTSSNYLNRETKTLIKDELLAIIDDPDKSDFTRYDEFKVFRLKLLSHEHGQDWTWDTPNFFLFRWLSTFLPTSITQWFPHGSRLRQLLSAGEPEKIALINSAQLINKTNSKNLNLADFYTALFHNTEAAIIDIRNRIECWTSLASEEIINDILTRLFAAKKAIDPLLYSELLDQAYTKNERAVTLFFYKQYQKTQDDYELAPETTYIELTHLTSALKSLFITSFSPETRVYHGIELLYLISYNRLGLTDHEDPILQLLNNPIPSSPSETYQQLLPKVRNLFKQRFPEEFNTYKANQRTSRNFNTYDRNNDSTLLGLEWLYKLQDKPDHLCYHLARQLSELYLCHLKLGNTLPEKISQEEVYKEALTFIFNSIFPFQRASWNSLFDRPESLLDPHKTVQRFIPASFQQAEQLAGRFILAAQISEKNLLTSILQFHCEEMENNMRNHWEKTTLYWVLHRLHEAHPAFFLKAKTALEARIVLCIADLKIRKPADSSRTIDINHLEEELKARLALLPTYNIENTNEQLKLSDCLKAILTELCYLIRHPNVRINHIEWVIKDCLPQLRHNFSEKLRHELKEKCMKQHIYRAIKNDLAESAPPEPVASCTVGDLQASLHRMEEILQQEEPNVDNIPWLAKRAIAQFIHLNELKKVGNDLIIQLARFTPEELIKPLGNYPLSSINRCSSPELVISGSRIFTSSSSTELEVYTDFSFPSSTELHSF